MDIQQYAADEGSCEARISNHLADCAECRAEVAAYRSLFSAIGEEAAPAFDFDLPALVLSRIPEPKAAPKASWDILFLNLLVLGCVGAIGLPLYLYRGYLTQWFSGIMPVTIWLLILPVLAVLIFQGLDLYKKYQKQMNALDH
jgi:hypothetical protein